jgi:hypothetical protein
MFESESRTAHLESVDSRFLDGAGGGPLTEPQLDVLRHLRWRPSDLAGREGFDPPEHDDVPNWHRTVSLDNPGAAKLVASILVRTLVDVHSLKDAAELDVTIGMVED